MNDKTLKELEKRIGRAAAMEVIEDYLESLAIEFTDNPGDDPQESNDRRAVYDDAVEAVRMCILDTADHA